MKSPHQNRLPQKTWIAALKHPEAYAHAVDGPIVIHETHISIVFLAGEFAYKIKKPVKTDFLDYSTLALREHFCREEVRLDSRYASDLYLDVVPVMKAEEKIAIEGGGVPIEYAVKMRRFPENALLSERIKANCLTTDEVFALADVVAEFHLSAEVGRSETAKGWPDFLVRNFCQIIETLQRNADQESAATLNVLHNWSHSFFVNQLQEITDRVDAGSVRECHGDLHLANVVHWGNRMIPFDGIEFNEHLRWIDVLSDAAFLAMDFAARGRLDLSRSFINAYLERTADYGSLGLLPLFLVYRSLVRALAASMRFDREDVREHLDLAFQFTLTETPQLWITHGVSGSGKTTLSETMIHRHDAIRLRSDIERKRLFSLLPTDRPSSALSATMYNEKANARTYDRLSELAGGILMAGYSVIIDATFLKRSDRARFSELAAQRGVAFSILNCHSDLQTLRQRVADRSERNDDASDADLNVLEHQLEHLEPLSDSERQHAVNIPALV